MAAVALLDAMVAGCLTYVHQTRPDARVVERHLRAAEFETGLTVGHKYEIVAYEYADWVHGFSVGFTILLSAEDFGKMAEATRRKIEAMNNRMKPRTWGR